MTLYEMGSVRSLPDNYNIRDVYAYTNNTTPVVFMMPNTSHDKGSSSATKGQYIGCLLTRFIVLIYNTFKYSLLIGFFQPTRLNIY